MRILGFEIERRSMENPAEPITAESLNEAITSGSSVTEQSALSFSAIWACLLVRSNAIAQLPVGIFENTENGKEPRKDHPVYPLIYAKPNELMTAFQWKRAMQMSCDLHGNGYSRIIRKRGTDIVSFQFLENKRVKPKIVKNKLYYTIEPDTSNPMDRAETIPAYDMINLVGFSTNGYEGKSVIQQHRETVGFALDTQKFGAKFYKNGANIGGVIKHPGKISDDVAKRLQKSWTARYSGVEKVGKTAILEEGMTYEQFAVKLVDAQYIETMRFSVEDICRIFSVPPHMVADLSRSTNNNIEEQGISFVRDTTGPIVMNWEQELNSKIFTVDETGSLFVKFNMNALLRGNAQARGEYYQKMITNGVYSPNECRELEDMNPREGGDVYFTPLNMTTNTEDDGI